jgi:hypothetical protein
MFQRFGAAHWGNTTSPSNHRTMKSSRGRRVEWFDGDDQISTRGDAPTLALFLATGTDRDRRTRALCNSHATIAPFNHPSVWRVVLDCLLVSWFDGVMRSTIQLVVCSLVKKTDPRQPQFDAAQWMVKGAPGRESVSSDHGFEGVGISAGVVRGAQNNAYAQTDVPMWLRAWLPDADINAQRSWPAELQAAAGAESLFPLTHCCLPSSGTGAEYESCT